MTSSSDPGPLKAATLVLLGLVAPALLARVAIPGIDLDSVRELVGGVPMSFSLAAILLVPWVSGVVLVESLCALVPRLRLDRRSPRAARVASRAGHVVGALMLVTVAFGLRAYFDSAELLVDHDSAPWLVLAAIVGASSMARGFAHAIERAGAASGLSVVIAGELLANLASELPDAASAVRSATAQGEVAPPLLAAALALALTAWLAGLLPVPLGGRLRGLPITTPVGLVPLVLAVFATTAMQNPAQLLGVSNALLVLSLRPSLPRADDVQMAVLAATGVLYALPFARTREAAFARVGVAPELSRARLWLATFANTAWLMLLVHVGQTLGIGALAPQLVIALFLLRELSRELQIPRAAAPRVVAALHDPELAQVASHVLTRKGIAHVLTGGALRSLCQLFSPVTSVQIRVASADGPRAEAALRDVVALVPPETR